MTYKPIIVPDTKQQRITIPKELELEPGNEIVLLYLDDYKNLNPDNTNGLIKDNNELRNTIKELTDKLEEKEELIKNLTDSNKVIAEELEEKANKLARYEVDYKKLGQLEERVKNNDTVLEKVIANNKITAISLLNKMSRDYEESISNFSFMDRIRNRLKVNIDLNEYETVLKEDYLKELETTKANVYYLAPEEEAEVINEKEL